MLNYRKTFNCSNKTFHLVILKLLSDLIDLLFLWLPHINFFVIILSLDGIILFVSSLLMYQKPNHHWFLCTLLLWYAINLQPSEKILVPKPGNCLIFLPKLFPCEGDWPLAQLPRGAVGSPSLEMFMSCLGASSRSAAGAGHGQYVLQCSFQPQPLRFGHLVILWLSEIPLFPILL